MKKTIIVLAAMTAIGCCAAAAQAENRAGAFNLTPVIGGYTFDGTQDIDENMLYGLRAGYNFTDRLGLEGLFHFVHTNEQSTGVDKNLNVFNYRLEALYSLFPKNILVPHIAAGYGGIRSEAQNNGIYDTDAGVFSYGIGAKYFVTDDVALRADLRQLIINRGPTFYNYEYTLGLNFQLGGVQPVAAPAPAPKAVAPPPPPAPTSSLTVSPTTVVKGSPATLNWTSANTSGCSITPDIGGVQTAGSMTITPDASTTYSLSCSGAGGTTASTTSLAVTLPAPVDSDMDGVPDSRDKCPGTPAGVKVDADGCPLDTDKDGVADYLDKCPGTPLGVKVDADGCPLDSDKDGVTDNLDKCPDTPVGTKVNKDGCPLAVCKKITLDLEFDFNKADVKPADFDKLKNVAVEMKSFDTATVLLEGHTDNKGAEKYNMKLSQRRADAVRSFIIEQHGIDAGRLTAKGFGESKPVASNASDEGRAKNRRVEAVFTCH